MDSLKDANSELESELLSVKQQLLDLKMSDTATVLDEKDRKKKEKMASMLAGFQNPIQDILDDLKGIEGMDDVRKRIEALGSDDERLLDMQDRLTTLQQEHENLLSRNLSSQDVEEIKQKLEGFYVDRREIQSDIIHDLRDEMTHKTEEIHRLRQNVADLQNRSNGPTSTNLQQQIADFDLMKKNLMRDLQNRCERVVELEISLDETREQYNNVLRSSTNRQQQKKMAFLERNLEQLTVVQRQLVEQNTSLKKEVAIAERKLIARNDRILSLEGLLAESQEKLTAANHRYVYHSQEGILLTIQVRNSTSSRQRKTRSRQNLEKSRSSSTSKSCKYRSSNRKTFTWRRCCYGNEWNSTNYIKSCRGVNGEEK
jgi:kinesin family protein 5